eukprot:Awhi_evm1s9272
MHQPPAIIKTTTEAAAVADINKIIIKDNNALEQVSTGVPSHIPDRFEESGLKVGDTIGCGYVIQKRKSYSDTQYNDTNNNNECRTNKTTKNHDNDNGNNKDKVKYFFTVNGKLSRTLLIDRSLDSKFDGNKYASIGTDGPCIFESNFSGNFKYDCVAEELAF